MPDGRYNVPMAEDSLAAPYAGLTPDCVLDALDSVGLRGDGRLLALNSYENRVYQVGMEDGPPVVAKFYRPARWSTRRSWRSMRSCSSWPSARFPVVAPLALAGGATLQPSPASASPCIRSAAAARRSWTIRDTLEWMGASSDASTRSARCARFARTARARYRELRRRAARLPARPRFHSRRLVEAWSSVVAQALDGVRRAFDRAGGVRDAPAARRLPRRQRAVDRRRARISSTSTTAARGPRCRTCGCCSRASAPT